jgi:hypothetical protein
VRVEHLSRMAARGRRLDHFGMTVEVEVTAESEAEAVLETAAKTRRQRAG